MISVVQVDRLEDELYTVSLLISTGRTPITHSLLSIISMVQVDRLEDELYPVSLLSSTGRSPIYVHTLYTV
jgi:hypothetical protein